MRSHHETCHVTTVMCLFIVNKKKKKKNIKRNIKLRKINKRKMLVSKYTIILNALENKKIANELKILKIPLFTQNIAKIMLIKHSR